MNDVVVREGVFHVATAKSHCNALTDDILRYIPKDHRDRVFLAYRELIANALKAAEQTDGRITIAWLLDGMLLRLELTNPGAFTPTWHNYLMPSLLEEHGRGIPMVFKLTDDLKYTATDSTTTVTAYWHLSRSLSQPTWKEVA